MCWEMVAKTRDTVDLVGLARHLPGAGEQRLLRGEGAQGAGAVRDLRRPQCSMVHIYMNELIGHFYEQQKVPLIRFQHRSIDGSMNIYACVQEHKAAGVHAPHPGGPVVSARLAVAGAGQLRGGPGALAEGGAELVPHRHGHRLEDHPEHNGHARCVRRLRGGAAGDEGMGDERGDHRLAGHAAGHLRARSLRDVPRLVRVLQHLPEVLRPCPRRPPLLQAEEQVLSTLMARTTSNNVLYSIHHDLT